MNKHLKNIGNTSEVSNNIQYEFILDSLVVTGRLTYTLALVLSLLDGHVLALVKANLDFCAFTYR